MDILARMSQSIFAYSFVSEFIKHFLSAGGGGVDPFPLFRLVHKEYIFLHAPLFPLPLVIPLLNGPSIKKILFFHFFLMDDLFGL